MVAELAAQHIVHHPFAIYGYLFVQIIAAAGQQAGTFESKAFLAALKSGTFQTAMGPVSFAANGDMKGIDFTIYQWKDGAIQPAP